MQDPQPLDPKAGGTVVPVRSKLSDESILNYDYKQNKPAATSSSSSNDLQLESELDLESRLELVKDEALPDSSLTPNIMPQMTNDTLKAALGRSSWHLFHTILARYPETPTQEERETLKNYIYLFAQVYPCGDCAAHFQKLLAKYPPQTSGRVNAAMWGCMLHNKVNDRLGKELYDCTTVLEDYDCGCGEDEAQDQQQKEQQKLSSFKESLQGSSVEEDHMNFEVVNEGKQGG